jgi:hypothetical protein
LRLVSLISFVEQLISESPFGFFGSLLDFPLTLVVSLLDFPLTLVVSLLDFPLTLVVSLLEFPLTLVVSLLDFPLTLVVSLLDFPLTLVRSTFCLRAFLSIELDMHRMAKVFTVWQVAAYLREAHLS